MKDIEKVNEHIEEIISNKTNKDVLKLRCDIEQLEVNGKIDRIFSLLEYFDEPSQIIYRIDFWQSSDEIIELIESRGMVECTMLKEYEKDAVPGVILLETKSIRDDIMRELLFRHFNYELARVPAFNMKIQLLLAKNGRTCVFNFYDDRGFDTYFVNRPFC